MDVDRSEDEGETSVVQPAVEKLHKGPGDVYPSKVARSCLPFRVLFEQGLHCTLVHLKKP